MVRKYKLNEKFFEKDTPESYYVLGYIFADGHLSFDVGQLRFNLKDKKALEFIRKCMSSNQPIREQDNREHKIYYLSISSKKILTDLNKRFGLTNRKTHNLPKIRFKKSLFANFLRGYFDGDGCVFLMRNKYRMINFTSVDESFLKHLNKEIERIYGISGNIQLYTLIFAHRTSGILGNHMAYAKISFDYFSNKMEKYEETLDKFELQRKFWTKSEKDYIRDNYKTMKYKDMAKILDRTYKQVESKVLRMGLRKYNV